MNRHACIVALVLLAAQFTRAADAPATRPAAKERVAQSIRFFEKIMLEDYDRVGRKSEKWDVAAKEALAAAVRLWALEFSPTSDEHDVIWYAVKKAREAGCDDPLVRLTQARNYAFFDRKHAETMPLHLEAAEMLEQSGYHPLIKCYAWVRAAERMARSPQDATAMKQKAMALMDKAMAHLPAVAADADLPRVALWDLYKSISDASMYIHERHEPYVAPAFAVFDKHCKDRSLLLAITADFYCFHAWEDGPAPGFADAKLMAERLAMAELAAEESWKLDPTNDFPGRVMQRVESFRDDDPDAHEKWFQRAIAADPESYEAYTRKIEYFKPYNDQGGVDKMLAFGRECAAGKNYAAGIPLMLVEAHEQASYYHGGERHREKQQAYFKDPKVWEEIRGVYESYLAQFPDSLYHRSRYATLACWAEDWKKADEQFRRMGKRFSYAHFRNDGRYRAQLAEVRKHIPESASSPAAAAERTPASN